MKCVAYIRVSTREQDEEVQRKAIEDFAKTRGIEVLNWYIDRGESGAKLFRNRPGAKKLLEDIEKLQSQCVLAWSIDRLGRSMFDTMNTVLELENKGVKVIAIKEEFLQTLDHNIRKLILSILSWVAEYERKRIRERQEEAWKQGKRKGRPPKVDDTTILKYYKEYVVAKGLSIKDTWKIMRGNGVDISYSRLRQRLRKLRHEGRIIMKIKTR